MIVERTNLAARAGRLERVALEDGTHRMARLLHRCDRGRSRGRKAFAEAGRTASGETRVAQKILDGAGFAGHARRERPGAVEDRNGGRRLRSGRGERRGSHRVRAAGGRTRALAARPANRAQVADGGHSALVQFEIRGEDKAM